MSQDIVEQVPDLIMPTSGLASLKPAPWILVSDSISHADQPIPKQDVTIHASPRDDNGAPNLPKAVSRSRSPQHLINTHVLKYHGIVSTLLAYMPYAYACIDPCVILPGRYVRVGPTGVSYKTLGETTKCSSVCTTRHDPPYKPLASP